MDTINFTLLRGITYKNHREILRRGDMTIILRFFEESPNFRFDTHVEICHNNGTRVIEEGETFKRNGNREDYINFSKRVLDTYEYVEGNIENMYEYIRLLLGTLLVINESLGEINENN